MPCSGCGGRGTPSRPRDLAPRPPTADEIKAKMPRKPTPREFQPSQTFDRPRRQEEQEQ